MGAALLRSNQINDRRAIETCSLKDCTPTLSSAIIEGQLKIASQKIVQTKLQGGYQKKRER